MTAQIFDIKITGAEAVARKLAGLPVKAQKGAMRRALRRTAERAQNETLLNLSGNVVQERTGAYVDAMAAQKVRVLRNNSKALAVGVRMPTRVEVGITEGEYYPVILEYDVRLGPKAPIRKAVNRTEQSDGPRLARDLASAIEREWART